MIKKNVLAIAALASSVLLSTSVSANTSATCMFDTIKASTEVQQYFDNKDGSILDVVTGITWSACLYGQTFDKESQSCTGSPVPLGSFSEAIAAQFDFSLSGNASESSEWRLPNIKELATLVEYACIEPAMRNDIFSSAPSSPLWSNTPNITGVGAQKARIIDFKDGAELIDDVTTTPIYARFIRVDED